MRGLACVLVLSGCDVVFSLDAVEPADTLCFGRNTEGGLFDHCLSVQPPVDLDGLIDIDTDNETACTEVVTQADLHRTEVCVLAARTIEIRGAVIARGARPLVLAAIESFAVTSTGSVSVASHRRIPNGAGATFMPCPGGLAGSNTTVVTSGGAGGAGGSFQTLGGQGGAGNGNTSNAQPIAEPVPGFVRGGCPGGDGGKARVASAGGRGAGGGALYIMAGTTIEIAGVLDASGEGGGFGGGGSASQSGGGGGGGGGSGGMLALDAPQIVLASTAKLLANGGGGGGGGSSTQPGKDGFEADWTSPFPFVASGGDGGAMGVGGPGGRGAAHDTPAAAGAPYSGAGGDAGGGGGGGAGYIFWFGSVDDRGAGVSPAPL